jgi:hypothetical protein
MTSAEVATAMCIACPPTRSARPTRGHQKIEQRDGDKTAAKAKQPGRDATRTPQIKSQSLIRFSSIQSHHDIE